MGGRAARDGQGNRHKSGTCDTAIRQSRDPGIRQLREDVLSNKDNSQGAPGAAQAGRESSIGSRYSANRRGFSANGKCPMPVIG